MKDYSENAGMLDALVAAGVVAPAGRAVPSGYVELHVVRVTPVVDGSPESPADVPPWA